MTEVTKEDVRQIISEYVKGDDFRSVLSNQLRNALRPDVYGCSISYDMGGTQTGKPAWVWGYTTYDKGGYHGGSSNKIVIPNGLDGLYMILADATVTPMPGNPATATDIDIVVVSQNVLTTGGGPSSRSFGGSGSAPLDWASSKFLELDAGDSIQLTGGASTLTSTWKSELFTNHLTAIRFPFG